MSYKKFLQKFKFEKKMKIFIYYFQKLFLSFEKIGHYDMNL